MKISFFQLDRMIIQLLNGNLIKLKRNFKIKAKIKNIINSFFIIENLIIIKLKLFKKIIIKIVFHYLGVPIKHLMQNFIFKNYSKK
jgi:hypothetical protein